MEKLLDTLPAGPDLPAIGYVFVIMLESAEPDVVFGPASPAPYLAQTLSWKGYMEDMGNFTPARRPAAAIRP